MESKKTKLTISGAGKKSIRNIEIAKTQGKKSVVIDKTKKNFVKKDSTHKSSGSFLRSKSSEITLTVDSKACFNFSLRLKLLFLLLIYI